MRTLNISFIKEDNSKLRKLAKDIDAIEGLTSKIIDSDINNKGELSSVAELLIYASNSAGIVALINYLRTRSRKKSEPREEDEKKSSSLIIKAGEIEILLNDENISEEQIRAITDYLDKK